jgi:hypothetical protein
MGFGDEFLKTPDLFPARFAGHSAGDGVLVVDVAGGPYRFSGLSTTQQAALESRYGERCIPSGSGSAIDIVVFAVDGGEFLPQNGDGRAVRYDFDYTDRAVRIAGHQVMARIAWDPSLHAAFWTSLEDGPLFFQVIENCFRSLVAYRLLECGGAALHSSALVDGDAAWVFYGHSGAGKTTVARRGHATGREVLSDDLNAVFVEDSVPYVAKLPFAGELGHSNERVGPFPLAGLVRLQQSDDESWEPMSPAAAVAAMAACAPFLNGDSYRLPTLLANLEPLVRGVASGTLRFTLEGDFWPLLEART